MASNRVICTASFLYSLILVLNSTSYEPSSLSQIFRPICHLLEDSNQTNKQTLDSPCFSLIYSYLIKAAFLYSISIVFLSTAITFTSYSSFHDLAAAATRHWKPFFASVAAAIVLPAILRPPSFFSPYGTYFAATLIHVCFTTYVSVKLLTVPMLEAKFGKDVEVPNSFSWWFIFWQISVSVMQIVTLYVSKEAYKMQLVFGIAGEVIRLIWLASFYELIVFTVLIYELRKKKKQLAGEGNSGSEVAETAALLVDEH